MPQALLPLELIQLIVDILAYDNKSCIQALKNCALASWSFLPICRKHLFASLRISVNQVQGLENLVNLLRNSPEVAAYTRSLHLSLPHKLPPLPKELKLFSRLESYTLSLCHQELHDTSNLYWIDFDEIELQSKGNLLSPMSTLKTLTLCRVANFPFYEILLRSPNIRCLELEEIDVNNIFIPTEALSVEPIKLESFSSVGSRLLQAKAIQKVINLQQSNGQPVFDLSGLKHLCIICYDHVVTEMEMLQPMLLQRTDQLVTITLGGGLDNFYLNSFHLDGLAVLLLPSLRSLKEITIDAHIETEDSDEDLLCGLCEELEILGGRPNVLETLICNFVIYTDYQSNAEDEWRKLDQVIDRFAWPMLKKIQIDIGIDDIDNTSDCEIAAFKRRLDAWPEMYLPKLFSKTRKDLDFQFVARVES